MNGMFGIDCSSPSATGHFVVGNVGFHPTLYCASPLETKEHVSATAETASKLRQMNVSARRAPLLPEEEWRRFADGVGGIVRNKYANNPGKYAAWLSASHVEKAPKKK